MIRMMYQRGSFAESFPERTSSKMIIQTSGKLPTPYRPCEYVHQDRQIDELIVDPYVGYVSTPDLVRIVYLKVFQKVGIVPYPRNACPAVSLDLDKEMLLSHYPKHSFAADLPPLSVELGRNTTIPIPGRRKANPLYLIPKLSIRSLLVGMIVKRTHCASHKIAQISYRTFASKQSYHLPLLREWELNSSESFFDKSSSRVSLPTNLSSSAIRDDSKEQASLSENTR